MNVATTSIEAYAKLKSTGRARVKATQIVEFLALHTDRDFSRSELADALGMRLSTVCGQVCPMLRSSTLVAGPTRKCQITGEKVGTVRLRGLF